LSHPSPGLNRIDRGTELFVDAVRGLAALLVLGSHAFDLAISRVYGWGFGENPPGWRFLRAVFGTGEQWVWCFFVISGFCIHLSIARSLKEGRFRLRPYLVARVSRIYPLYLIGLGLAVVTYHAAPAIGGFDGHVPTRQFWASVASLQIFTNTYPSYDPSWSLSCEMIYYVLWPVLLLVMRKRVDRAFQIGMAGSIGLVAAIFFVWAIAQHHRIDERAFVDGLWALGALFPLWLCGAWLASNWDSFSVTVTRRIWLSGVAAFGTAMMFLFTLRYLQYPPWSVHMGAWAALPGIFLVIAGGRYAGLGNASERVAAACRWLGQFSYPCYLLHFQLMHLLEEYGLPLLPSAWVAQPMVRFGVYLAVLLPVLALIGPPIERAFMGWRTRLLKRIDAPSIPVPA
jgi:peptidoglycan/LPS O-acetylase OafA/YrhL